MSKPGLVAALLLLGFLVSRGALAQPVGEGPEADTGSPAPAASWLHLSERPQWAAGLEGYTGIAAQFTDADQNADALLGGLVRLRGSLLQAGASYEVTDSHFGMRTIGGFAGVWLPFHHWVDVEGAIGLASRRYWNDSTIYGPTGLDVSTAALTFRVGVSDRMTERVVGARIGAALVASADLKRPAPEYHSSVTLSDGSTLESHGTTALGGITVGLVIAAGFEVGGGAKSRL